MVAPTEQAAYLDEQSARMARAERVRAMLRRWAAEDVSDEPDWDVADIEPIQFRVPVVEPEASDGSP